MALTAVQLGYLLAAAAAHIAHVFALALFVLVLAWVLHFRGGGARLHSDDPNLIFNVHKATETRNRDIFSYFLRAM